MLTWNIMHQMFKIDVHFQNGTFSNLSQTHKPPKKKEKQEKYEEQNIDYVVYLESEKPKN